MVLTHQEGQDHQAAALDQSACWAKIKLLLPPPPTASGTTAADTALGYAIETAPVTAAIWAAPY